jgi:hypothetical protein
MYQEAAISREPGWERSADEAYLPEFLSGMRICLRNGPRRFTADLGKQFQYRSRAASLGRYTVISPLGLCN